MIVFNKADLVDPERREEVLGANPGAMAIAAAKREGLPELLRAMDRGLVWRERVGRVSI
jgi:50S ribosomal subunit-associated GTPase HflX